MSNPALFIFGLGYVGQHLARALMSEGVACGRNNQNINSSPKLLKIKALKRWFGKGTTPFPSKSLEGFTHILVTVPPDEKGDVVLRHVASFNKLS